MIGKKLKFGDTIGITAPASCTSLENLEKAKKTLEDLGFKIVLGKSTKSNWFSFAGKDEERAEDINNFFSNPEIDAVMCMRGGYGCNRMVDFIDFSVIEKNPKIFIGFSDVTTLHSAINRKTGLVTFHGPMAVSNFGGKYNEETFSFFKKILMEDNKDIQLKNFSKELKTICKGKASGKIVGGNLATLTAVLGTEYDFDYNGKILFIEEVEEKTYKIDRMLNQLKKSKVFEKVNSIILGDFNNCIKNSEKDMSLLEVLNDYFKDLGKPVVYNFESGHCEPMITLPIGAEAVLDACSKEIKIIEKVVE